jgi:hypothetical protein
VRIKNRTGVGHVMQAVLAEIVAPPLEPSRGSDGRWKLFDDIYDLVETPPETSAPAPVAMVAVSQGRPWVRRAGSSFGKHF